MDKLGHINSGVVHKNQISAKQDLIDILLKGESVRDIGLTHFSTLLPVSENGKLDIDGIEYQRVSVNTPADQLWGMSPYIVENDVKLQSKQWKKDNLMLAKSHGIPVVAVRASALEKLVKDKLSIPEMQNGQVVIDGEIYQWVGHATPPNQLRGMQGFTAIAKVKKQSEEWKEKYIKKARSPKGLLTVVQQKALSDIIQKEAGLPELQSNGKCMVEGVEYQRVSHNASDNNFKGSTASIVCSRVKSKSKEWKEKYIKKARSQTSIINIIPTTEVEKIIQELGEGTKNIIDENGKSTIDGKIYQWVGNRTPRSDLYGLKGSFVNNLINKQSDVWKKKYVTVAKTIKKGFASVVVEQEALNLLLQEATKLPRLQEQEGRIIIDGTEYQWVGPTTPATQLWGINGYTAASRVSQTDTKWKEKYTRKARGYNSDLLIVELQALQKLLTNDIGLPVLESNGRVIIDGTEYQWAGANTPPDQLWGVSGSTVKKKWSEQPQARKDQYVKKAKSANGTVYVIEVGMLHTLLTSHIGMPKLPESGKVIIDNVEYQWVGPHTPSEQLWGVTARTANNKINQQSDSRKNTYIRQAQSMTTIVNVVESKQLQTILMEHASLPLLRDNTKVTIDGVEYQWVGRKMSADHFRGMESNTVSQRIQKQSDAWKQQYTKMARKGAIEVTVVEVNALEQLIKTEAELGYLDESGRIIIDGTEYQWVGDETPHNQLRGKNPRVFKTRIEKKSDERQNQYIKQAKKRGRSVVMVVEVKELEKIYNTMYFEDKSNILHDLGGFANVLGKKFEDISTGDRGDVVRVNKQETSLEKYLADAGIALGYARTYKEASHNKGEILRHLKSTIITFRDQKYYTDRENIEHDLKGFAEGLNPKKTIFQLSTGDKGDVVCNNGDTVKWGSYLAHACMSLGLADTIYQSHSMLGRVLNRLKKQLVQLRDKEYYENRENISHDLQGFANQLGKRIEDINTDELGVIICKNGEHVTWNTYVLNAGIELGYAKNSEAASKKRLVILQALKKTVDISPFALRDATYYNSVDNILYDLKAYASSIGKDIYKISTSFNTTFICATGEPVLWHSYLISAGVALGMAENTSQAYSQLSSIMLRLKEMVGIRSKSYFFDRNNIESDLTKFALKHNKVVQELIASDAGLIECVIGEPVSWHQYLSEAGIALGLSTSYLDAANKRLLILNALKDQLNLIKRDNTYYMNIDNIRHDLSRFANDTNRTISDLKIAPEGAIIYCNNGEKLTWNAYLIQAGIALGIATNSTEGRAMRTVVLESFKQNLGVQKITLRNEAYYQNADNIMYDLHAFATVIGKEIYDISTANESVEFICKSGEKVFWNSYLIHAGQALKLIEGYNQGRTKKPEILEVLKSKIGIIKRDKDYYTNPENVLHDLQQISALAKKDIKDLTADSRLKPLEIICTNHETVKWQTYILNAAIVLGLAIDGKTAKSMTSETLVMLKKIAGVEHITYPPRDAEYFANSENIKHDLLSISTKNNKGVMELTTREDGTVDCITGESVSRINYIANAGVVLGFAPTIKKAKHFQRPILDKLLELAGYVIQQEIDLNNIHIDNPLQYKKLTEIVGFAGMMEVFLIHHHKYCDVPFAQLQKVVGSYLGTVSVNGEGQGRSPLQGMELDTLKIILSVPTLQDALINAIKAEYMSYVVDYRKNNNYPSNGYQQIFDAWLQEFTPQIQQLYPDVEPLMNTVIEQMHDIFTNTYHTDNLIEGFDDAGREFPGFEQRYNIAEFIRHKRFLVADEMGLGKTATAICAKEYVGAQAKTALVVCPANMIPTWCERLSDMVDTAGKPIGYFKQGHAPKVLVLSSKDDCQKDFTQYDYVILSSAKLNDNYSEDILQQKYDMMIVDEVHEVKNMTSGVWSKNLIELSDKLNDAGYVMTLSGTPIPNRIKDIAIHMRLLYPHEFEFVDNRSIVKGMVSQDKLNVGLKLRGKMSRKRLTDWVPMPNRVDTVHTIQPSQFERDLTTMIVEDENQTATQKIHKLRKLYMCPQTLNSERNEIVSVKMQALGDMIIDKLQHQDKVMIILNDFIQDMIRGDDEYESDELLQSEGYLIDYIKGKLDTAAFGNDIETLSYHGDVSLTERKKIQDKINISSGKKVLFLSGNAAKVGIDLSGVQSVIVYNHPWTKSDLEQQLSRVYRVGLKHELTIDHLITANTIEEGIWNFMHEKDRITRKLIDGKEILTEAEKEILLAEDVSEVSTIHHADQEFAKYYFNQKEFLYDQFSMNKGVGQDRFVTNMQKITTGDITRGEKYAEVYSMLGRRNYQYNANRVNNTIIQKILTNDNIDTSTVRVLDMASANQVLMKTATSDIKSRITSNDVNISHFPSGNNIDALLTQPAYTNQTSGQAEYMWGSMTKTLYDEQSFDIINCSLAWHYTALNEKKELYDRITSLIEMNRILKPGGHILINEIYSLKFADLEDLKAALDLVGFELIDEYSGEIHATHTNTFRSNMLVLKKVSHIENPQSLFENGKKKTLIRGLKFDTTNKNGIHGQSTILDSFTLGGQQFSIPLNIEDRNLQNEEARARDFIMALRELHRDPDSSDDPILHVPEKMLFANGMFSFYDTNKAGTRVRRVARKLSDGSFIFIN